MHADRIETIFTALFHEYLVRCLDSDDHLIPIECHSAVSVCRARHVDQVFAGLWCEIDTLKAAGFSYALDFNFPLLAVVIS